MKKKIVGIFVCTLLIATIVLPTAGTSYREVRNTYKVLNEKTMKENLDFSPGEFFVKFREGTMLSFSLVDNIMITGIPSIDTLNRNYKVRDIEETILGVNKKPKNPELFESIGLNRIFTFKCDEGLDVMSAVESFREDPNVEFAEPNYFGHGCLMPNDASFNLQWGLHNTGQTGGTPDADIDGPEAWDITLGSFNVVIAIVDTGIDYNHEDLNLQMWQNPGETPSNGIDDDGNGYIDDIYGWNFYHNNNNPMDSAGHGTHCAGIAGARSNNNIGVTGVAWFIRLMAVKVAHCSGAGCFDATDCANGIIYAADNGADVLSMSWSFDWSPQVIENACDYAYGMGCFLVAAIGNHGTSALRWPAAYSTVMAVGATDHDDNRCSWSAYGNHINVVAPGKDIYSTLRNDNYGYMWGTSMSTPHVAGLAGLLKAQDPTRVNSDIWTIIVNTADDLGTTGWDQYYGMGRINAYKALYGAPYKPILDGPPNGKVGEEYTYTALTWDPNNDKIYYWFDWGDGTNSGWVGLYNSGQSGSASHKWSTKGTYNVKAKAKDINGKESPWSDLLSVTMPKNQNVQSSQQSTPSQQFLSQFLQTLLGYAKNVSNTS